MKEDLKISGKQDANPGASQGTFSPEEPITGDYIPMLAALLSSQKNDTTGMPDALTNAELAYLLNIPSQQISGARTAPSSMDVIDRRINKDVPASEGTRKAGENLKCIRPYHAILIRLYLKYPEYAAILPPAPDDYEVFELIFPFLRPTPGRRWFAQHFGRSLVTSYKMLPPQDDYQRTRENSRPVTQLQTLILLRFAKEFRELYQVYRDKHMLKRDRDNPLYQPISRSWDILRERDSLTEWMTNALHEKFEDELLERWRKWWEERYLKTLDREAKSRDMTLDKALKSGSWHRKEPVTDLGRYDQRTMPITGADNSLLVSFRDLMGLSSSESFWVLGIAPKTYFMYRTRNNQRIDPSVSILMRHFITYPDDLELLIPTAPNGQDILNQIKSIDPEFTQTMIGPFFGGGSIAGYNMVRTNHLIPAFARRAASLLAYHSQFSSDIYWHLKECAEDEARARGLDLKALWQNGVWHKHDASKQGGDEAEAEEQDDLKEG